MAVRLLASLVLLLALGGCGRPQIVAGDERTVTIKSGPIGSPEKLAQSYCGTYGKRAVPLGGGRASRNSMEAFFSYNCVDPEP